MLSVLRSRASQLALRRGLGSQGARQLHTVTRPLLFGVQNAVDRTASKLQLPARGALPGANASPRKALKEQLDLNAAIAGAGFNSPNGKHDALAAKILDQGLVVEVSVLWLKDALQNLVVGMARNLFYTFRPVLMLFVFGQLLKVGMFAMGAPMLMSFYSVWLFEVFYGLLQVFLSFIFVGLFYNDIAFCGGRNTSAAARRVAGQVGRAELFKMEMAKWARGMKKMVGF